jgi:general secretion pathway protein G
MTVAADSRRTGDGGFTLVELLVVLVILGLLATVGGLQVVTYLGRARADTARVQLEDLTAAIDLYRIDMGRSPTQSEGLASLIERPADLTSWRGPYLRKRSVLTDPWGRAWIYRSDDGGSLEVQSLGADGQPGGDGDNADVSSNDRR